MNPIVVIAKQAWFSSGLFIILLFENERSVPTTRGREERHLRLSRKKERIWKVDCTPTVGESTRNNKPSQVKSS